MILLHYPTVVSSFFDYFQELVRRASPFKVILETLSKEEVPFLETTLRILPCGRVGVGPFVKPTSLLMPLSTASGHPLSTHRAWPMTMCKRLMALSSNSRTRSDVRKLLISRFRNHHCHTSADWLLEVDAQRVPRADEDRCLWVSIPYHPWWGKILNGAARSLNIDLSLEVSTGRCSVEADRDCGSLGLTARHHTCSFLTALPNALRTAGTIDAGILWLEDGDGRLASVVVLSSTTTDLVQIFPLVC